MKKSISFVLVAFLILFGIAKTNVVSAQNVTHPFTMSHYGNWEQTVPLYCEDGVPIEVEVVTDWHCVCHYLYNAEWDGFDQVWMLMRWRGSFTYNGVDYEINDQVTWGKHLGSDWNNPLYYNIEFNSNVKGSDGSHLKAQGVFIAFDENWNWIGKYEYSQIVSN
jgi:hypothetical protein